MSFLVQSEMCPTCIYRKDSPLDLKKLEQQVADPAMKGFFEGFRICHEGKEKSCCRGFWNKHKNNFTAGQIAQRLDCVEEV